MANGTTELKRIFSWLGLAPALANVVGPVLAGTLIDFAGFQLAFAVLAALPLASLVWARFVPVEARADAAAAQRRPNSWDLLGEPGFTRLLFVNWLLASSWDVHTFLVPILGHERGFSASAIGLVLGVFAIAVAAVRLVIPLLAHRLRESQVLVGAMLMCARGLRDLSVRAHRVGDGLLRGGPRPGARRRPADGHDDAAPDHAGGAPRRGDRLALDGDQPVERDDAARVRPRRRDAGRVGAVLGDGRGGRERQPGGAPRRRGKPVFS